MATKATKKSAKQPANKSVHSTKKATASAKVKMEKPVKTAKVKLAQNNTVHAPNTNTNRTKPAAEDRPTPGKKTTTAVASMKPAAAKKPREAPPQKKNAGKSTAAAKTTLSARAAWPFPTAAKP